MPEQYDPFSPQHVDESIELLSSPDRSSHTSFEPWLQDPNIRLVQDLQKAYHPESDRYQQVLRRVEDRLVEQRIGHGGQRPALVPLPSNPKRLLFQPKNRKQGKIKFMDDKKSGWRRYDRVLSLLIAVFVLVVLVGGLLVLQSRHTQNPTTGSNNVKTPKPATHTPAVTNPFGKIIYTTSGKTGFSYPTWSPDSKHIAIVHSNEVQIWDASTGRQLAKVPLPSSDELIYGMEWSPTGQTIAVATNQALRIVDGTSGTIIRSYTAGTARTNTAGIASTPGGKSFLSAQIPTSGGLGIRAMCWSPDGRSIAIGVSAGPYGYIQILNAQTATLDYTLQWNDSYNVSGLDWSSDGQYLAANVFNTQGGTPPFMMWAWNLSNREIVFKQPGGDNAGTFAFQPKTHNLAFAGFSTNAPLTIGLWNVATGKKLITYSGKIDSDILTWSPDGQQLAYIGYSQESKTSTIKKNVTIVSASNGKVEHTYADPAYQGKQFGVSQMAWSPDGKYMVSVEIPAMIYTGGAPDQEAIVRVWTAN